MASRSSCRDASRTDAVTRRRSRPGCRPTRAVVATLADRDSKGPGRQSGGDRPANLPDMPIDGDRHRCRVLRRRPPGPFRLRSRRGVLDRGNRAFRVVPPHRPVDRGRPPNRGRRGPSRLWLSGREPRLRQGRDRRRPHLDRPVSGGDGCHGVKARVEAARRRRPESRPCRRSI